MLQVSFARFFYTYKKIKKTCKSFIFLSWEYLIFLSCEKSIKGMPCFLKKYVSLEKKRVAFTRRNYLKGMERDSRAYLFGIPIFFAFFRKGLQTAPYCKKNWYPEKKRTGNTYTPFLFFFLFYLFLILVTKF